MCHAGGDVQLLQQLLQAIFDDAGRQGLALFIELQFQHSLNVFRHIELAKD